MAITKEDLFEGMYKSTEAFPKAERITELDLDLIDDLFSFEHPFDKSYKRSDGIEDLTRQIRDSGVLVPITVRKEGNGRYECLAGHRRRKAARAAGLDTIPAIIRECTDEEAMVIVSDTNLGQRQVLLPSEKAKAYALKVEGLKRQGRRTDLLEEAEEDERLTARDQAAQTYNVSPRDISRYIRLTDLRSDLLDIIDDSEDKRLTVTSGFILADLNDEAQMKLYHLITEHGLKVSIKTARRIVEEELLTQGIPDNQVMDILLPKAEEKGAVRSFRKAVKSAEKVMKGYIKQGVLDEDDMDDEMASGITESICLALESASKGGTQKRTLAALREAERSILRDTDLSGIDEDLIDETELSEVIAKAVRDYLNGQEAE